jgi:hypothetical protein
MVRAIRRFGSCLHCRYFPPCSVLPFAGAWGQDATAFKTQDPGSLKPAAELGGDFFQVISLPDASTLIVGSPDPLHQWKRRGTECDRRVVRL